MLKAGPRWSFKLALVNYTMAICLNDDNLKNYNKTAYMMYAELKNDRVHHTRSERSGDHTHHTRSGAETARLFSGFSEPFFWTIGPSLVVSAVL